MTFPHHSWRHAKEKAWIQQRWGMVQSAWRFAIMHLGRDGALTDGLRRDVLRNLTAMPAEVPITSWEHGSKSDGSDLLSTREDERKLIKLVAIVRHMVE
jgi:hypothetical protein